MSRTLRPETPSVCEYADPVVIDGLEHPAPRCIDYAGLPLYPSPGEPVQCTVPADISPDGRWYLYEVHTGLPTQTPNSGASYALWALDLQTGERWQIGPELYYCGGCDGPSGSAWSASGRYYVHQERGPQRRATLIDFAAREVRDITWRGEIGPAAIWSPVADVLARTAGTAAMAITNFETGVEHIVPGIHPRAEFDASGRYLYADSGSGRNQTLTVVEVATGEVVQVFPGAPHLVGAEPFDFPRPVVATSQGFVAVLGDVDGCEGTSIQRDAAQLACIVGGDYASLSPDGTKVVMTREPGGPGFGANSEYDIVLYDIATDAETVVAEGARGNNAPITKWNASSSHVLIKWPAYRGR